MRVFTFQTPDVLDILQYKGIYYADIKLCREHNDYGRDIARLNGKVPIWVFTKMKLDDVASSMFTYRCEMSLDIEDFCKLVMIELELDRQPLIGLAHNSCDYACIIDSIHLSQLVMAYSLHPRDGYFVNISRIDGLVTNQLTPSFPSFYDTNVKKSDTPLTNLFNS